MSYGTWCGFRACASAMLLLAVVVTARAEQGVTESEILIGTVADLSGPSSPIGVPMRQGVDMGTLLVNEKGGIHGRKLRVVFEDSAFDARRGILAMQKLLLQDKVFAFMGQMGTAIVKATMPMAIEQGRPFLFPIALDPSYTTPPKRLVATWIPDYAIQMGGAARWAIEGLGKKRVCSLYQDGDSGDQSLEGINAVLKDKSLKLVESAGFKAGAPDLSSQVAKLKAADCDLVLVTAVARDGAVAIVERQKIGLKADFIMAQASTGASMLGLTGSAAEGVYGISTSTPILQLQHLPLVVEFATRYKQRYGRDMDEAAYGGYLQVLLFSEIARRAGPNLTVDNFIQALETVKDLDLGVGSSRLTFTPAKRLGTTRMVVLQVKDGKWQGVGEY